MPEVYAFVNQERDRNGLPPLAISALLGEQAQRHASHMNTRGQLYHSDPSTYGGEIIGNGAPNWQAQFDAWMGSPSHREIILGDFQTFGAAGSGSYRVMQFA